MKIAFVGNLCHLGYMITKALRELGHDADLYITCKNNEIGVGQNPKDYDGQFPEWVHLYNTRPLLKSIIEGYKTFSKYDRVIAMTLSPAYIQFFNKNYIAISNGSDLREFAWQPGIYNHLLKQAYKNSKYTFCSCPEMNWAPKKLGIEHKAGFFATPIEVDKIHDIAKGIDQKENETFTVFLPSSWSLTYTGFNGNKGTDIFLKGVEKLLEEGADFKIKMIDQSQNPNTKKQDLEFVQKIINKYPNNFTLLKRIDNRKDLIQEYVNSDLIADQFFLGMFGMIGLESLSCKKPLINSYHEKYNDLYDEMPPILVANTENEVYKKIKWAINNKGKLKETGNKGYDWVKKCHDVKSFAQKLIDVL